MLILLRSITYAVLFVGLVLVFAPAQLLSWSGVTRPSTIGALDVVAIAGALLGLALALWCVATFTFVGRGTPAPFDAPRRLVTSGPYRRVRNPMYIGAGIALAAAALFYRSLILLGYLAVLTTIVHIFVTRYEEPTLRRTFGDAYDAYCRRVGRWWPRVRRDVRP